GLDFGYLPDEKEWRARWYPSLLWTSPRSISLVLAGGDEEGTLQGCRPVPGALAVTTNGAAVVVVATALDGAGSTLSIRRGSRDRASGRPLASARLQFGRWTRIEVPPASADALWLEAAPGEVPCVESIQLRLVTE
ncbi:MAG: hypothetical protein O7A04_05565, partial [Acidobacteria bacterium]|nr:hypothetical protein [Acidobacteriota bacterium]